jgi:hypothetical protein
MEKTKVVKNISDKEKERRAKLNKFKKGGAPGPGRPKGLQNRSTEELKRTLINIANNALDKVEEDLEAIRKDNPARALEFALKLLEFATPRLRAMDVSGKMEVDQRIHQIQVNINGTDNKYNKDV